MHNVDNVSLGTCVSMCLPVPLSTSTTFHTASWTYVKISAASHHHKSRSTECSHLFSRWVVTMSVWSSPLNRPTVLTADDEWIIMELRWYDYWQGKTGVLCTLLYPVSGTDWARFAGCLNLPNIRTWYIMNTLVLLAISWVELTVNLLSVSSYVYLMHFYTIFITIYVTWWIRNQEDLACHI